MKRTILSNYQNNYVGNSSNTVNKFNILIINSDNILHIYFNNPNILFLDLYLAKFLDN